MSYNNAEETSPKDWEDRLSGPEETPDLTRFLIMNYLVNGALLLLAIARK